MPALLHLRVPIEYYVLSMAVAKANFMLALGRGLSMIATVWVLMYLFMAKKLRRGMVHPITIGLLAVTATFALGVIKLV